MKRKHYMLWAAIFVAGTIIISCGNKTKKTTQEPVDQEEISSVLEVDSLLAKADSLVKQKVVVEGVCTHICAHGGRKIFLMGSDDTQTIRIEAGEVGKFEQKCVNSIVRVTGTLVEDRIDEAYLQNWEEKLKAKAAEQHGKGEQGCSTEKQARGETANTPQKRIADFRSKIAKRKAKEGKEYLSFYHIEATSYEIVE
ncbi:hypothetical protein [uncultured Bacteroides sp.]|uniref:hypothetical protein n=1 Tax=uncultured Bacteroides sp. TaxID=162156 RepID=UPI002AAC0FD2|nr:hypothetical protein [uncultured Bacteroides sp.]